jgi:hypothetical protein
MVTDSLRRDDAITFNEGSSRPLAAKMPRMVRFYKTGARTS